MTLAHGLVVWWRAGRQQPAVEVDAFGIVDVRQAAERLERTLLELSVRGLRRGLLRVAAQARPASIAAVHVLEAVIPPREELA